jgi:hypothetical protein
MPRVFRSKGRDSQSTGFAGTGSSRRNTGASALMRTTMSSSLSLLSSPLPKLSEKPPLGLHLQDAVENVLGRGLVHQRDELLHNRVALLHHHGAQLLGRFPWDVGQADGGRR